MTDSLPFGYDLTKINTHFTGASDGQFHIHRLQKAFSVEALTYHYLQNNYKEAGYKHEATTEETQDPEFKRSHNHLVKEIEHEEMEKL